MSKPTIINTKQIAKSRIFAIESVDLAFSNGEKRCFERFYSQGYQRGAVIVVLVNEHNELLVLREYAVGLDHYELTFCKGVIDAGETPEQAAQRELQEEVGVKAGRLDFIKKIAISPAYMMNHLYLYLARDLTPSKLPGDEPEPLTVLTFPLTEPKALIEREDFSGALSISALFLTRDFLQRVAE